MWRFRSAHKRQASSGTAQIESKHAHRDQERPMDGTYDLRLNRCGGCAVEPLSYVHGRAGPPLVAATIGAFLDDVAVQKGAHEALVCVQQGVRWTYAELKAQADAFAAGFWPWAWSPGIG
jgi:hypothetical protein